MNGFEVTKAALRAPGLDAIGRVIFALICDSIDAKGVAYLCKQDAIAEAAPCSIRKVRDTLALLEENGWIKRSRRHRQTGERGGDILRVTPNALTEGQRPKPRFKLDPKRQAAMKKPPAVVEPRQRTMPLPVVIGGQEQADYRQEVPVVQPAGGAGSEDPNRQEVPVVQPAGGAGLYKNSSMEDSYKTSRPGRSPHGSGGQPAISETQAQMALRLLKAAEANGHGPIPERLQRRAS